jgi:hypothetical protein
MIAKGTTHDNGGKLAVYMITGKKGERAELWQLRGFASDDIKTAFRSVHVMAAATKCEQPLFHVQVRNPAGENLTPAQWEQVADRIESKLGLSGQPRAIAFHREIATGDDHMHVGWSRIDDETLTAKTLSFYKLRLKEVSRDLEADLGLTRVSNHRDGPVMAPTRDEDEQGRRLGVDIREVRATIRECWEHSDNGRSFRAALSAKDLTLAKGDERDFIVLDHEGGMHALGKRVLGSTAKEVRARMADVNREQLPTVNQARRQISRERANAKVDAPIPPKSKEPTSERELAAIRDVKHAYQQTNTPAQFIAALESNGIRLALVTGNRFQRSHGTQRQGEIVAVDQTGRIHGIKLHAICGSDTDVKKLFPPRDSLIGVEDTQREMHVEAQRFMALTTVGLLRRDEDSTAALEVRPDWKLMLKNQVFRSDGDRRDQRSPERDPGGGRER